ncbi:ATP-binding protein [Candidatus Pacearchaeota archaeon]|nr:ATP-binding protein [Candidatus Pacearchaeota archaeon]
MILKETLRKIVRSQKEELVLFEEGIERERLREIDLNIPFAIVLSGIRRSGKSTLLKQLMKKIKNFYYFNFEDPRASNFELDDFQKLNEIFVEEYGEHKHYFFDEIQNVNKWELFIRALLDKRKNVVITGSNASLLSKELGTRLTGRHLRYELFPFSFKEYLKLTGKKIGMISFEEYLTRGGFPEYLKLGRANILQELLSDIINRDIAIRHKIRNVRTLRDLSVYLLTNISKEFSYNKLKKIFNLGSVNSIISFISYFEDSYLLFAIPKFDYSFKKQIVNPKKIYSIDNGLSIVNSASFSEDKGRLLENLVFIKLRQNYKEIFYFQENWECDFVIKEGVKITRTIQVCTDLNEDNKAREINGLTGAIKKFNLNEGLILTYNQEEKFKVSGKTIRVLPVWKWLLE